MRHRMLFVGMLFVLIAILGTGFSVLAQDATCPGAPAPRLIGESEGRVAQVYSSLRQDIGSPVILRTMLGGETFEITGNPVCSGPHYWYPITYQGISGWATEGYLNSYWLEPIPSDDPTDDQAGAQGEGDEQDDDDEFGTGGALNFDPVTGVQLVVPTDGCMGAPAPQFSAGDFARVAQSYSSVRPGVHSNRVLFVARPGNTLEVLSGPVCGVLNGNITPYNWYEVRVQGTNVTGWVTEGTNGLYWLAPAQGS